MLLLICFFLSLIFLWWFGGTSSVLHLPQSIQIPCVSNWFWQTTFLLACKNMVCQNQVGIYGTWTDSENRKENLCKAPKSSEDSSRFFVLFPSLFPVCWVSTGTLSAFNGYSDVVFWWAPLLSLFCLLHGRVQSFSYFFLLSPWRKH